MVSYAFLNKLKVELELEVGLDINMDTEITLVFKKRPNKSNALDVHNEPESN